MTPDSLAFPHAAAIAAAIPDELIARGLDDVCFVGVVPGAAASFDYCGGDCGGMAWVRVAGLFPSSTTFPYPDAARRPGPILLAQQFEVGIVRAIVVPDDGEAPDEETQTAEAGIQLADMRAILAVICGYFTGRDIPFLLGSYTPYGPEGGCTGGSWTVTAQTGMVSG